MVERHYNATAATANMPVGLQELDAILAANMRPLARDAKKLEHLLRRVRETLEANASDLASLRRAVEELKRDRRRKGVASTLNPVDALRFVSPEELEATTDRITRDRLRTLRMLITDNMSMRDTLVGMTEAMYALSESVASSDAYPDDVRARMAAVAGAVPSADSIPTPFVPTAVAMALEAGGDLPEPGDGPDDGFPESFMDSLEDQAAPSAAREILGAGHGSGRDEDDGMGEAAASLPPAFAAAPANPFSAPTPPADPAEEDAQEGVPDPEPEQSPAPADARVPLDSLFAAGQPAPEAPPSSPFTARAEDQPSPPAPADRVALDSLFAAGQPASEAPSASPFPASAPADPVPLDSLFAAGQQTAEAPPSSPFTARADDQPSSPFPASAPAEPSAPADPVPLDSLFAAEPAPGRAPAFTPASTPAAHQPADLDNLFAGEPPTLGEQVQAPGPADTPDRWSFPARTPAPAPQPAPPPTKPAPNPSAPFGSDSLDDLFS